MWMAKKRSRAPSPRKRCGGHTGDARSCSDKDPQRRLCSSPETHHGSRPGWAGRATRRGQHAARLQCAARLLRAWRVKGGSSTHARPTCAASSAVAGRSSTRNHMYAPISCAVRATRMPFSPSAVPSGPNCIAWPAVTARATGRAREAARRAIKRPRARQSQAAQWRSRGRSYTSGRDPASHTGTGAGPTYPVRVRP
jgi:hypothetical protein